MEKQLLRAQTDRWNGTGGSWAQGYRAGNVVFLQGQTGLNVTAGIADIELQPVRFGVGGPRRHYHRHRHRHHS